MGGEPFFEPWPRPDEEQDVEVEHDHPWQPPMHVHGVVVPVGLVLHRGADVVVQVPHVVAFRRGLELHLVGSLRPGTGRGPTAHHHWEAEELRVGVRLADGTRVGHTARWVDLPDEGRGAPMLVHRGGEGGFLRSTSSWWLTPLPQGDTLEVVVQWDRYGVPESSAHLDLTEVRAAAEREDVLWDPPPPPPLENGWHAFVLPPGAHPFPLDAGTHGAEPEDG